MRRAAKTDDNQPAIVDALRAAGVAVEFIGKPVDLLVCVRKPGGPVDGVTSLMEVKNPLGKDSITKEQAEFISRWPGKVHIVRSVSEALQAAGMDVS